MAKFVKFTNASMFYDGNDIFINTDHITTIYRNNVVDDGNIGPKPVTVLYSAAYDKLWEVKEDIEEVFTRMKNA